MYRATIRRTLPSQLKPLYVCIALVFASSAMAEEALTLPDVKVTAERLEPLPALTHSVLGDQEQQHRHTSDTAALLADQPGISLIGAGGVSSMPVIHGLADDRVRIKLDGMDLISACANHMNPPLSYIDPSNIGSVKVFAGIAPVSLGGDSIGGTIQANSAAPEFAQAGQEHLVKAQATTFYRSNNQARGVNLSASAANEILSVRYTGATVEANNYKAGGSFKPAKIAATGRGWLDGDEVGSSSYQSQNHALAFALRNENHLLELKIGVQNIDDQGFPNQRMDMTGNNSQQFNLRYAGQYDWGNLETRVYQENTRHSMQFGNDKLYWYGTAPGMPMETDGSNTGLIVKGDVVLSERDIARAGVEYQRYRLNDWWLPSGTGMMMAPNTFWNINNGERDRYAIFGEWEARWNPQWTSQLGLRHETVKMDAGNVQGYSAMYGAAATTFNAASHQHTDRNWDITALSRFTANANQTFEAGYAMKTRSPNLYERYVWANSNSMVMNMNNWVGDGNGYVGNLNLKPEVAHTVSVTGNWHDTAQQDWNLTVSPYYTHVEDYIDAASCTSVGKVCAARTDGFVNLSLANQTARLYGTDISGNLSLAKTDNYGSFNAKGLLSYVRGRNTSRHDNLYNIMPLNLKLAVEHHLGNWTNTVEAKLVDAKTNVQALRKELQTSGYGLINLYSSYQWHYVRFDFGVENLLDKYYANPLGGAYIGQGNTMSSGATAPQYGTAVPGMGRSINTSLTINF